MAFGQQKQLNQKTNNHEKRISIPCNNPHAAPILPCR